MKNTIKFIGVALIAVIALAGCPTGESSETVVNLDELSGKPSNTEHNPYTVKLKITNENDFTTIGLTIHQCAKYVYLDLSGSTITKIPSAAFSYSYITGITIPNSITSIEEQAFLWCTGLTAINVNTDNTAYSSQDGVLYNKDKTTLIKYPAGKTAASFTIPNSVTSIGSWAFGSCTSLTSITIPNSVTSIGNAAFFGCTSLISITIPNSVTTIGGSAFSDCTSLTSITIPASVTSIGKGAFAGCSGLTTINVDKGNTVYSSQDGVLYSKDKTTLIAYPEGKTGAFTIPASVTSIGRYAFSNCSGLTSVTIPASVTSIGDEVFYNCTSLTGITIPNSVTSIGDEVFYNCTSLTSVIIPDSVESIGERAFYGCSGLTSVTIPNSVTSIGRYAFYNCTNLVSVTFLGTIPSNGFGNVAFNGNLRDSFYAANADNGTPGTYTTTNPGYNSIWTKG